MTTIDHILEDIGGFGKAQLIVMVYKFWVFLSLSWSMIQIAFSGITPNWICNIHDLDLTSSENGSSSVFGNLTGLKTCSINGTVCDSYTFPERPLTMISQWNLVCDLKWVKATVTSIQMAGVLGGSVLSGYFGDYFGRRYTNFAFLVFDIVVTAVTGFSTSWVMFAICRFLVGFGIGGTVVMTYVYCLEFTPTRWRALLGLLPSWVVGYCVMALVAHFVDHSPYHHFINAATYIPCLAVYFLVPESIRWLAVQSRIDDALAACQRVARYNKRPVPEYTRDILEGIAKEEASKVGNYNYLDLIKGIRLIKATVLISCYWLITSMIFYGISFAVSSFAGVFSLNLFLMAIADLPFVFITYNLLDRIGRKKTSIIMYCLAGLCAIGCVLTQMYAPLSIKGACMNGLAIAAKVSALGGWLSILIWGPELYPTVIRSLALGAHSAGARIGGMLAPFFINLDQNPVLSFVIVAGMSFAIVISCLTLPETKGQDLTDSMASHVLQEQKSEKQKMTNVAEAAIISDETSIPLNPPIKENVRD